MERRSGFYIVHSGLLGPSNIQSLFSRGEGEEEVAHLSLAADIGAFMKARNASSQWEPICKFRLDIKSPLSFDLQVIFNDELIPCSHWKPLCILHRMRKCSSMHCICALYSFFSLTESDGLSTTTPLPRPPHSAAGHGGPPVVASVYDHGMDGICLPFLRSFHPAAGPLSFLPPPPTTPRCLCKCWSGSWKSPASVASHSDLEPSMIRT